MCACVHVYVYRLDSNCTVKVTDGALAQQLHPECYYTLFGATRPVRWAAVETLQEGLCTSRSNVVSKVTCTMSLTVHVCIYMHDVTHTLYTCMCCLVVVCSDCVGDSDVCRDALL